MRILLIEDYKPLRESVTQGLTEAGLAVDATADGEEGLRYAQGGNYDAILLDIMLPGLDGLTLLQRLRKAGKVTPVLLLTAKDTVNDRVRALVRRQYGAADSVLRVGDLEVDTAKRSARRAGESIALTAREFALLEFLAHRAGQVVSRTEIWEHVYDFHSSAESNVVDVYIGYLRKKIERPTLPRLIHTRRGWGYMLGT